jgi:tungstate transport system ATP-binding protein
MMYRLDNVERKLGSFVLSVEDCRLQQGGIYTVAGPNGCGKSTLLRLLACLDVPTKGNIEFADSRVDFSNAAQLLRVRRRIGILLQSPYLFNMSVKDNVAYGLRLRGVPRAELRKKTDEMLSALLLKDLAARPAHQLSGGEAQRVALARTLALDADVYLLDEPTANVDQRNIHIVERLVKRLNEERGTTVVFSTHSKDQAFRMSRNQLSIIDGRISDVAYENVFAGRLRKQADGVRVIRLAEAVEIKVGHGEEGEVTIAVDPEDIILSREQIDSSALNTFRGPVTKIENVDGSIRVFVDAGINLCAMITQRSFSAMDVNIGRDVWLTFKANAVRVIGKGD